jgi:hypothetical protein
MAGAIVLTDKAKFKCAHMPAALGTEGGITISALASKTSVAGARPILNGATIGGFTLEHGCNFGVTPANPKGTPCMQFDLSAAPATGSLSEGGHKVYTQDDLAAIALVPAKGSNVFGLVISESQSRLKA